ncbi:hypothetical protein ACX0HA_04490 [Flavobacterium hauense]
MNFINSLNDKYFTLNGVQYFRNYVSAVHGNKIEIYNCYERKDVLVPLTHFSEFTIDGSVYTSASLLQAALLDVMYSRLTTGDSSSIDQNNVGRVINAGNIGPAENIFFNAASDVAYKLNNMEVVITAKQTPVIITASLLASANTYNYVAKRYKYLFKPGKGNWGRNGTPISWLQLELITVENYLIDHLLSEPNAIINNLGELPDGNFVTAANVSSWDFSDSGAGGESGLKTYYFSYETNDVLYFVQFVGVPGLYGSDYIAQFTTADFVSSTDSRITEVPTLEDILEQGGNTNVSQLINDGDGASPYATIANVNGLTVTINQAAAELYLKNSSGVTLATVNLGFLNNEGTTFFFNIVTQNLELRNDAGVMLSEIPVSAFVSNIMHSVDFNTVSPQVLEFKDAEGNIRDSITITLNNILGLQTILNSKSNVDGSNATGNWPISITGTSESSNKTSNWLSTLVTDFNLPTGFKLLEAVSGAMNRPGQGQWGQGIQFSANSNTFFVNQLVFDVVGNIFTRTKSNNDWSSWSAIPFDENVLHKEGDETKSGNLTINGNNKGYYLGNSGNNASIIYNDNGNLDITPRSGYDTVFTAGRIGIGKLPEYKLDVNGSIKANGSLLINTNTNPGFAILKAKGAIEFDGDNFNLTKYTVNSSLLGSIGQADYTMTGGNPSSFGISSNGDLQFGAGYLPSVMLKVSGNIGIRTISPQAKTHIADGQAGNQLMLTRGTGGVLFSQSLNEDGLMLYNKAGTEIYQRWHQTGNITIGNSIDNGYKLDINGNGRFVGQLIIPDGETDKSAINKAQLQVSNNSMLFNISNSYIPKIGETTKLGVMTFVDPPIVPDAIADYNPITRKQFRTTRFADFVLIKGIDYTIDTVNDMGQTGIFTIYINAISNNVTITLPTILQVSPYYTYNFKRIDNSTFTAKIVSPMTIDGQTLFTLGYLHSISIKSVDSRYWIFSKYTP